MLTLACPRMSVDVIVWLVRSPCISALSHECCIPQVVLYLQLGSLNDNTCRLSWAQHTHSLPKGLWEKYVRFQAPAMLGYLLLQ